jgi:hypothetical protein
MGHTPTVTKLSVSLCVFRAPLHFNEVNLFKKKLSFKYVVSCQSIYNMVSWRPVQSRSARREGWIEATSSFIGVKVYTVFLSALYFYLIKSYAVLLLPKVLKNLSHDWVALIVDKRINQNGFKCKHQKKESDVHPSDIANRLVKKQLREGNR